MDLISRQAAIEALEEPCKVPDTWTDEFAVGERSQWEKDVKALNSLPSAKPERPFEIQDILDYLDTVLHPIISPEYWNVYSELYDMISMLPSAERRGRWEDVEHAPNGLLYATCSVCGKRQTVEATNYCGNCGARMEAGE